MVKTSLNSSTQQRQVEYSAQEATWCCNIVIVVLALKSDILRGVLHIFSQLK